VSARRRTTYDDLCKVPQYKVAEIINGELIVSPRPASPHARAASAVGSDLFGAFDGPPGSARGPGGWWILVEPELHFGEDVLVPDIAGWRRQRMPLLPNVAAFTEVPDWVCEVVSASTAQTDRAHKTRIYAREQVGHLWMVDPLARTLEVYRLEGGRWVVASTHGGAERACAEPFQAVELDIGRWWLQP